MKKILFFFCLIFLSLNQICITSNFVYASENLTFYAKVISNGVFFYSACNDNSQIFEIPTTYFVLLTGDANEKFYTAKYGNLSGFVHKNEVVPMNGKPENPYAIQNNFRITSMSGLTLHKKATFESDEITTLPFLESDVEYYGKLQGQELFPNSTSIWLYASYMTENKVYYGYLFSYYCDFETKILENEEYFEEITETLVFTHIEDENRVNNTSDTLTALIILAIAIPLLIGCYFFITPTKKRTEKEAKPSRKRHKDYYELSENDLN